MIQGVMTEQVPGNVLLKRCSKKILKRSQENTCAGFSFLIKFQNCSDTGIFLSILQKFLEYFFW